MTDDTLKKNKETIISDGFEFSLTGEGNISMIKENNCNRKELLTALARSLSVYVQKDGKIPLKIILRIIDSFKEK